MPEVIWFELPVDKPGRAMAFYRKAFGWSFEKWNGPMESFCQNREGGREGNRWSTYFQEQGNGQDDQYNHIA